MKIIRFEAENVKRLQTVEITPTGDLVVIGGENAQGKSSVLDSIMMALAGGKSIPKEPIHRGKQRAEIRLDLGELIVTRRFSVQQGPSLIVTEADGKRVSSPQTILDKLTSQISFDPLAFSRMNDLEQKVTLQKLLGLDFTELDTRRAKIYAERTVKNREVDSQKHRLQSMQRFPNAPKEPTNVADLTKQLRDAEEFNERKAAANQNITRIEARVNDIAGEMARAEEALKAAQQRFDTAKAEHAAALSNLEQEQKRVAKIPTIDTAPILEQLNAASELNEQHSANARFTEEAERLRTLEKDSAAMTKQIEQIDADKASLIEGAQFPVPGLGFSDEGVLFNELPFSQASDAEKLRVSVAMGIAMNPKLKVLLIRDGSLLDANNLALVARMAADSDAQVWIERVGKGKECSVIIEDGRVLEERAAE